MEFERLDFVEAIEELASFLGLDVPREQRSGEISTAPRANSEQKRNLYDLMGGISNFYRSQLKISANKPAIDYLKIVVFRARSSRSLVLVMWPMSGT